VPVASVVVDSDREMKNAYEYHSQIGGSRSGPQNCIFVVFMQSRCNPGLAMAHGDEKDRWDFMVRLSKAT
jgi:hypothetical protein